MRKAAYNALSAEKELIAVGSSVTDTSYPAPDYIVMDVPDGVVLVSKNRALFEGKPKYSTNNTIRAQWESTPLSDPKGAIKKKYKQEHEKAGKE